MRCIVTVLVLALAVPLIAQAKGTMRVQQSDGSVQVYQSVTFAVAGRLLAITTADKKGTLLIDRAACSFVNKLLTCIPDRVQLKQNGATNPLDFERGTVYFNTTDETQQLIRSSTRLAPNGILGALKSPKGTYVTWSGTLDSYAK
jgi:hypothetical protein